MYSNGDVIKSMTSLLPLLWPKSGGSADPLDPLRLPPCKAVHGGKSNTKTLTHALPWLAGSYPLDWMDFMESGIFGFLMKNWIDSAKKIRASPKFAFRGQMDSSEIRVNLKYAGIPAHTYPFGL